MSKTVFNKVDYDLGSLVQAIAFGEIGLPDIQRQCNNFMDISKGFYSLKVELELFRLGGQNL